MEIVFWWYAAVL